MALRNKIGSWVTGEDFFDREMEVEKLTRLIDGGDSVLMVAPRRVGKTSLIRETFRRLEERGTDRPLYVDLEHCSHPHEFVTALAMASQPYASIWRRVHTVFQAALDKVEKAGVPDLIEITIRETTKGDWREKGHQILLALVESERPVTVCFDELPIMLSRMLAAPGREYADCQNEADIFLSWLRMESGRNPSRLRFVICGSIGMEPIAARHGLSHTINHLTPFHLNPWTRETTEACLRALAERYGLQWRRDSLDSMLDEYLRPYIPHHVQMFFQLLHDDAERVDRTEPGPEDIRRVYHDSMLSVRGHAELTTYEERLTRVLGGQGEANLAPLAMELLTEAAVADSLTNEAASRIAARFAVSDPPKALREVLGILEHDGYLQWSATKSGWVFTIRLLKDWWYRRFSIGHLPAGKGV